MRSQKDDAASEHGEVLLLATDFYQTDSSFGPKTSPIAQQ